MRKTLLLIMLIPTILTAQVGNDNHIVTTSFKKRNLIKIQNYNDEPFRLALIKYLESKNLNPYNYYLDSLTIQSNDTLIVNIWDIVGIENIHKIEKINDSLQKANSRLKYPKPVGNPGNCFTAYYRLSTKEIVAIDIWQ